MGSHLLRRYPASVLNVICFMNDKLLLIVLDYNATASKDHQVLAKDISGSWHLACYKSDPASKI